MFPIAHLLLLCAGVITFLLLLYLAMHLLLLGPQPLHSTGQLSHSISKAAARPKGLQSSSGDDDSDAGLPCSGDSCCDWRCSKPWRYLKLSQTQGKGQQRGVDGQYDGASSDTPTAGSTGSGTAVELV